MNRLRWLTNAEPPVGELRYQSPLPLQRLEELELDCSKERDVSHQRDPFSLEVVGCENCLFLNVYAPKAKNSDSFLPVMVWIHGGGFFFGNGNSDFHFPTMQDVIVVTLNYRLGALGFLSLPEEGIHGNMKHVQENLPERGSLRCAACYEALRAKL